MEVLTTARLRLVPLAAGDFESLCALNREPATMRFQGGVRTAEQTRAELARILSVNTNEGFGGWAVRHREDGQFLGRCGIKPAPDTGEHELLYSLREAFWGKGYATEAASAILERTLAGGVARVVACVAPENKASLAVLKRLGMQFERSAYLYDADMLVYATPARRSGPL